MGETHPWFTRLCPHTCCLFLCSSGLPNWYSLILPLLGDVRLACMLYIYLNLAQSILWVSDFLCILLRSISYVHLSSTEVLIIFDVQIFFHIIILSMPTPYTGVACTATHPCISLSSCTWEFIISFMWCDICSSPKDNSINILFWVFSSPKS